MYFPFIIAKQYDLNALCEIDVKHYKKFIPVIIPVNTTNCKRNISKLVSKNVHFILVLNYGRKSFPSQQSVTNNFINDVLKNYSNYSIAFVISKDTRIIDIEGYINSFPTISKSLIHKFEFFDKQYIKSLVNIEYNFFLTEQVGRNYIDEISNNNSVLISDGFIKQRRNADYPALDLFNSYFNNFLSLNAIGFGDYTTIGNNDTTGFAAFSVALHLTVIDSSSVYVYHFVSDDLNGQKEIERKYNDALNELINFVNTNNVFETSGIDGFRTSYNAGHYPGLGIPKKWSIKNHIEQIINVL